LRGKLALRLKLCDGAAGSPLMPLQLIRCKQCRRPFMADLGRCPTCGQLTLRAVWGRVFKFAMLVLSVVALALAWYFARTAGGL
jgi:hypothetical protein